MAKKRSAYTFHCGACDHWASNLTANIEDEADAIFGGAADEGRVISFLDAVRRKNFAIILDRLAEVVGGKDLEILDVGCATGLFLRIASERGHRVQGIEPNRKMVAAAKKNGHDVLQGYFPGALTKNHKFDVIIFNDVFEHIPDITSISNAIVQHLRDDGLVVINLPNSGGVLFKVGGILAACGMNGLWDRLWQKMFYTPHLHYFSARSLDRHLARHALEATSSPQYLNIVSLDGLWQRISADKSRSFLARVSTYVSALAAMPVMACFEKDIVVGFYKKVRDASVSHPTEHAAV